MAKAKPRIIPRNIDSGIEEKYDFEIVNGLDPEIVKTISKANNGVYETSYSKFTKYYGKILREKNGLHAYVSLKKYLQYLRETSGINFTQYATNLNRVLVAHFPDHKVNIGNVIKVAKRGVPSKESPKRIPYTTIADIEKAWKIVHEKELLEESITLLMAEFIFQTGATVGETSLALMRSFEPVDKKHVKVQLNDSPYHKYLRKAIKRKNKEVFITMDLYERIMKQYEDIKLRFGHHIFAFATSPTADCHIKDEDGNPPSEFINLKDYARPEKLMLQEGELEERLDEMSNNLKIPLHHGLLVGGCVKRLHSQKIPIHEISLYTELTVDEILNILRKEFSPIPELFTKGL